MSLSDVKIRYLLVHIFLIRKIYVCYQFPVKAFKYQIKGRTILDLIDLFPLPVSLATKRFNIGHGLVKFLQFVAISYIDSITDRTIGMVA